MGRSFQEARSSWWVWVMNRAFKLNWGSYGNKAVRETAEHSIYVGELAASVTDDDLLDAFEHYEHLVSARIITDPVTKASKGYGFVIFSKYEES